MIFLFKEDAKDKTHIFVFMTKSFTKYFIAIVPLGEIQEKATALKHEFQLLFGLKYALKSPAHVTLKMPFRWNEAKEENLFLKLNEFFMEQRKFGMEYKGFGKFRQKVIFIKPKSNPTLMGLQKELNLFCKLKLLLTEELSDFAYDPHMTLAFGDIKPNRFDEYWSWIKTQSFDYQEEVHQIALLKKMEGKWKVIHFFSLSGSSE
jgi:2'-5' RNA ligase